MIKVDSVLIKKRGKEQKTRLPKKDFVFVKKMFFIVIAILMITAAGFVFDKYLIGSDFGKDFFSGFKESFFEIKEPPALVPEFVKISISDDASELVVFGKNLKTVEVFAKTADTERFWGEAKSSNLKSNYEIWQFQFPREPILVEEIIVKAEPKDEREKILSSSLALTGTATIYQLIWGKNDSGVFGVDSGFSKRLYQNQTAILDSGEIGVKFKEVVSDSRCPIDVYCFWQGEVSARLDLYFSNQLPIEAVLKLDPRYPEQSQLQVTKDLLVKLISVGPEIQNKQTNLGPNDYYVTVSIEKK